MKTIKIQFTRKVTFNKIIKVTDAIAKKALALDEEDLYQYEKGTHNKNFSLLAEDLTSFNDVFDAGNELENVSVSIYKPRKDK